MTQTVIQRTFAPIKRILPGWLARPIRSVVTAFLTPVLSSYRTGHFRSSFKMSAVSRSGEPVPWYTYPSIDFLKYRSYTGRKVLEFGGGQSTIWWAQRVAHVVTFESGSEWYERLRREIPENVKLHLVPGNSSADQVDEIKRVLASESESRFDVIVIDGDFRYAMIDIAVSMLSEDGIIVCDNSEGYGFYSGFRDRGLRRVDFYGNAPGVVLPHCTSIYFRPESFVFDPNVMIHVIAKDG
jgi:hypothetical protein